MPPKRYCYDDKILNKSKNKKLANEKADLKQLPKKSQPQIAQEKQNQKLNQEQQQQQKSTKKHSQFKRNLINCGSTKLNTSSKIMSSSGKNSSNNNKSNYYSHHLSLRNIIKPIALRPSEYETYLLTSNFLNMSLDNYNKTKEQQANDKPLASINEISTSNVLMITTAFMPSAITIDSINGDNNIDFKSSTISLPIINSKFRQQQQQPCQQQQQQQQPPIQPVQTSLSDSAPSNSNDNTNMNSYLNGSLTNNKIHSRFQRCISHPFVDNDKEKKLCMNKKPQFNENSLQSPTKSTSKQQTDSLSPFLLKSQNFLKKKRRLELDPGYRPYINLQKMKSKIVNTGSMENKEEVYGNDGDNDEIDIARDEDNGNGNNDDDEEEAVEDDDDDFEDDDDDYQFIDEGIDSENQSAYSSTSSFYSNSSYTNSNNSYSNKYTSLSINDISLINNSVCENKLNTQEKSNAKCNNITSDNKNESCNNKNNEKNSINQNAKSSHYSNLNFIDIDITQIENDLHF